MIFVCAHISPSSGIEGQGEIDLDTETGIKDEPVRDRIQRPPLPE
jgi:hypothetical protein